MATATTAARSGQKVATLTRRIAGPSKAPPAYTPLRSSLLTKPIRALTPREHPKKASRQWERPCGNHGSLVPPQELAVKGKGKERAVAEAEEVRFHAGSTVKPIIPIPTTSQTGNEDAELMQLHHPLLIDVRTSQSLHDRTRNILQKNQDPSYALSQFLSALNSNPLTAPLPTWLQPQYAHEPRPSPKPAACRRVLFKTAKLFTAYGAPSEGLRALSALRTVLGPNSPWSTDEAVSLMKTWNGAVVRPHGTSSGTRPALTLGERNTSAEILHWMAADMDEAKTTTSTSALSDEYSFSDVRRPSGAAEIRARTTMLSTLYKFNQASKLVAFLRLFYPRFIALLGYYLHPQNNSSPAFGLESLASHEVPDPREVKYLVTSYCEAQDFERARIVVEVWTRASKLQLADGDTGAHSAGPYANYLHGLSRHRQIFSNPDLFQTTIPQINNMLSSLLGLTTYTAVQLLDTRYRLRDVWADWAQSQAQPKTPTKPLMGAALSVEYRYHPSQAVAADSKSGRPVMLNDAWAISNKLVELWLLHRRGGLSLLPTYPSIAHRPRTTDVIPWIPRSQVYLVRPERRFFQLLWLSLLDRVRKVSNWDDRSVHQNYKFRLTGGRKIHGEFSIGKGRMPHVLRRPNPAVMRKLFGTLLGVQRVLALGDVVDVRGLETPRRFAEPKDFMQAWSVYDTLLTSSVLHKALETFILSKDFAGASVLLEYFDRSAESGLSSTISSHLPSKLTHLLVVRLCLEMVERGRIPGHGVEEYLKILDSSGVQWDRRRGDYEGVMQGLRVMDPNPHSVASGAGDNGLVQPPWSEATTGEDSKRLGHLGELLRACEPQRSDPWWEEERGRFVEAIEDEGRKVWHGVSGERLSEPTLRFMRRQAAVDLKERFMKDLDPSGAFSDW